MNITEKEDPTSFIVLGATGGIGSELSRILVSQGARLIIAARTEEPLRTLAQSLDAIPVVTDVTDPEQVDSLMVRAKDTLGTIHGIAHCVGSLMLKPAHRTSNEEWSAVMQTNLYSSFFVLRAGIDLLKSHGGAMVFISTAAALTGFANHEAIAAAKAGIIGLVRAAAATYANRGIRINAVAPGLIRTPLTAGILRSAAMEKASTAMHALGRIGEPRDVAEVASFLLQPSHSWITGQVYGIDGGLAHIRTNR
jgi:NAD(P)-dependent dehydrogenase (short-subunit alcohol dehydrogenase family)